MHRPHRAGPLLCVALASCGSARPTAETSASVQISAYPMAPTEDRRGHMWFPTAFDGVVRLAGSTIVAFTTADGLPSDTVRDAFEDSRGTLWLATGGGLCRRVDGGFETLTEYRGAGDARSPGSQPAHLDLWDVHEDRHGTIWIAGLGGVFRLDAGVLTRFLLTAVPATHVHEFTPDMVYCVFEARDGALWFGTDGAGVIRYDTSGQRGFTTADGLCSDHVCSIVEDPRGELWFGTSNGGVSRFDGAVFTTLLRNETFSPHNGWGRFLGLHVDRDGNVWFGRASPGGGAYRYDGRTFAYLSTEAGLGDGGVIDIGEDRSGRVWLGTTSGMYRFEGGRFVNVPRSE